MRLHDGYNSTRKSYRSYLFRPASIDGIMVHKTAPHTYLSDTVHVEVKDRFEARLDYRTTGLEDRVLVPFDAKSTVKYKP